MLTTMLTSEPCFLSGLTPMGRLATRGGSWKSVDRLDHRFLSLGSQLRSLHVLVGSTRGVRASPDSLPSRLSVAHSMTAGPRDSPCPRVEETGRISCHKLQMP